MQGAVVLFVLLVHWLGDPVLRQAYEARIAALRKAGQPVRYEDLETPRVPDEENAAVVFAEAHRILKKREESEHPSYYEFRESTTPEERQEMRAYLESLKPYFDLLMQVPKRPRWYLEHEWKKGPDVRLDELPMFLEATSHLVWRTELDDRENGRTRRAAEAAVLVIDLGERCRMPMVLGDLVFQAASSFHPARVLRAASRQPGFDAAEFRRIVDPRLARAMPATGPSSQALTQERVIVFRAIETLRAGRRDMDGYLPLKGMVHRSPMWRPFLYCDANRALAVFAEAIALADKPPEEALRSAARLRPKCPTEDPRYLVTALTAVLLPRYFEGYVRTVAVQRLTRVVMALLEYRQQKGAWPESLDVLGEMPLDPYSGKPFVYEHLEGCYARIRAAREVRKTGKRIGEWEEWETLESDNLAWIFKE